MLRSNGNARALAGIHYLVDFVNRSWQGKKHHCWGMAGGCQGTGVGLMPMQLATTVAC